MSNNSQTNKKADNEAQKTPTEAGPAKAGAPAAPETEIKQTWSDEPSDKETSPGPVSATGSESSAAGDEELDTADEAGKTSEAGPGLAAESVLPDKPPETVEQSLPEKSQTAETETENQSVQAEPAENVKSETGPPPPPFVREVVKEIVKEVPRQLTDEDKEQIFRDRLKELSIKGNARRSKIHSENQNKIIEYLKTHGYITNNEVEKLCKVKNTAAWQLLQELESRGQIVQLGRYGPKVRYKLRQGVNL